MLEKIKNKKVLIIIICAVVILIAAGISFALWSKSFTQTGTNTNTTNCFDVTFSDSSNVSLTNFFPQTDEEGLTNTPYQVTVTNNCNIVASYSVILHKENTSTLANNHIKVAVDNNVKLLSDTTSKTSSINSSTYSAYEIGVGAVPGNSTKTINIRAWIDHDTSKTDGENKTLSYRITIDASPNSNLLAAKILKTHVNTTAPTTDAIIRGELALDNNLTGQTYQEYEDQYTTSMNSSSDKAVGSSYTFDSSTGLFNLTGTTATSVSFGSEYINYYTCGAYTYGGGAINRTSNCDSLFKIETVSGTTVTKSIRITSQTPLSGSGLFSAQDDAGTSYYYRGVVDNNYISFGTSNGSPLIWRVVRINGDGTIRLILNNSIGNRAFNSASNNEKYVGYTYDNESACTKTSPCISTYDTTTQTFTNNKIVTNSTIKTYLENWYKNNLYNNDSKVDLGYYCNDTSTGVINEYYKTYAAHSRISGTSPVPQLTCPDTSESYGGNYKLKIGLLNVDELSLAGFATYTRSSFSNYLYYSANWLLGTPRNYQSSTANEFGAYKEPSFTYDSVNTSRAIRPVINLKSDVKITSGDGTKDNPYVIDTN